MLELQSSVNSEIRFRATEDQLLDELDTEEQTFKVIMEVVNEP